MVHARSDEDTIGMGGGIGAEWNVSHCFYSSSYFASLSSTGLPGWKSREPGMVANGRFDICLGNPLRIRCANFYGDQRTRVTSRPCEFGKLDFQRRRSTLGGKGGMATVPWCFSPSFGSLVHFMRKCELGPWGRELSGFETDREPMVWGRGKKKEKNLV